MGHAASSPLLFHSGAATSASLQQCLTRAVGGDASLVAFPDNNPLYQIKNVKPYNLAIPVNPAAVTYPKNAQQVSDVVKCAVAASLKVTSRSGGHNYANYGLGNNAVVVDTKNLNTFSYDKASTTAKFGTGTKLVDVTNKLHSADARAIAHGTCPQIGLGGHVSVGGVGPTSRLYGTTTDHVLEAEMVLADGRIVTVSPTSNPDLFFAIRGAASNFGILTNLKMRTEAEPGNAVQYSYTFNAGPAKAKAQVFQNWLNLIKDPNLDRRFASEFIILPVGVIVKGNFYGSPEDFQKFNLPSKFPAPSNATVVPLNDWLGNVAHQVEEVGLQAGGGLPAPFTAKSLCFNNQQIPTPADVENMFNYIEKANAGTPIWFVDINLQAGAINDVPLSSAAYVTRDTLFVLQSYSVGIPGVNNQQKAFLQGINDAITGNKASQHLVYAGYVDPTIANPQQAYYGANLARLEAIKKQFDPKDVFTSPQGIRPAA